MTQCSICLSGFRDPVCIPCGHVYCKRCLTEHANAPGNDRLTAKCPECRASFDLVAPDLTYLPEKYHKFVTNNVRRVYVDFSSANKELREYLKAAEGRLARKADTEQALLKRCEELMEALNAHRQGERDANQRILELEDDIVSLENLVKEKDDKIMDLQRMHGLVLDKAKCVEKNNQVLQNENIRLSLSYHDMKSKENESDLNTSIPADTPSNRSTDLKQKQRKHRRHNAECTIQVSTPEDTPFSISMSTSNTSVASISTSTSRRPIKPLPKRRSVKHRLIGDTPYMSIDISDFM